MPEARTPVQVVQALNKYIIGQDRAKRAVAVALRNRWRRQNAPEDLRDEITPNNILMIGSTGVGKTEIARRLAQLADAPFVKVEASKFTEVGYVGRDVESMVRDLVEQSVRLVHEEYKARVAEKAALAAEQRLLDILIPPVTGSDAELNAATREKFRAKLLNGELDERPVEIQVTAPAHKVQVVGSGMEGMDGLGEMLQNMVPKKTQTRKLPVKEARKVLVEEEAEKLIDPEAVQRDALQRAQQHGIVFIDEIDKVVARSGQSQGPDVSREGVQRDLLPIVEGSTVNTKYGPVTTDHVLFIAAGAFHVSKPSDMIPELQGRFPIRVELDALTEDDFFRILTQPRNALTKQYQALLAAEGVALTFTDDALRELAKLAAQVNQTVENIGARRLQTLLSTLLEDVLFQVPDLHDGTAVHVTTALVTERLAKLVAEEDVSAYIL